MAKIIVYNNDTDRMEVYYRDISEAMPYNANRTLHGAPIPVGYAFRRPWEGGHTEF